MVAVPPRADVKVGFACNNRCLFCAQGDKRSECPTLPLDELIARLRAARERGEGLVLTGGEPTVHKQIAELIAAAKALGFHPIQIQTNGRLLAYPQFLASLIAAGATEFSPSLHGSTAAIHDELTQAPGSFDQTVAGLKNLARARARVVTNSVITRQNLDDLPALVALLASLGVRTAQLAFVHAVGTAADNLDQLMPRFSDAVPAIAAARQVARRAGVRLYTEAIPLCFLSGMEDLAVEEIIPQMTVLDLDGAVRDFSAWRSAEGKLHGPPCEACAARPRCEGPWREYPAHFGWSEFVPIPLP